LTAFWLFAQIKKAWRGKDHEIELPFSRISWKLTFKVFVEARSELVEAGFIDIVNPGGRSPGGKNPTIYALSERWKEVSKRLMKNLDALYEVKVPLKDGGKMSVWYPKRKLSESQENLKKARVARAKKRAAKIQGKRKTIQKRRAEKRIRKSPETEIEETVASVRRSLRDSVAFITKEERRTQ
jgi:hypothetical protein